MKSKLWQCFCVLSFLIRWQELVQGVIDWATRTEYMPLQPCHQTSKVSQEPFTEEIVDVSNRVGLQ
jgi:hypothetical protein